MNVLVDTCVWSHAFRRAIAPDATAHHLNELIKQNRAQILGVVRQEILSGIRYEQQFLKLRNAMRAFVDLSLDVAHYELAASIANKCRSKGLQGSVVEFLICAVGVLDRIEIYTTDNDFVRYARHVPIRLYKPRL